MKRFIPILLVLMLFTGCTLASTTNIPTPTPTSERTPTPTPMLTPMLTPTLTPTPTPTPTIEYKLRLLSWHWHREYSYITVEGEVQNISNERLENVIAEATFRTSDRVFVTSDWSFIDYTPLMPNQTSPFTIMVRDNPAIHWANIGFRQYAGELILTQYPTPTPEPTPAYVGALLVTINEIRQGEDAEDLRIVETYGPAPGRVPVGINITVRAKEDNIQIFFMPTFTLDSSRNVYL